jgi:hypothetical protein
MLKERCPYAHSATTTPNNIQNRIKSPTRIHDEAKYISCSELNSRRELRTIWKMYLPIRLKTYEANRKPMCLILSGTMRETLHAAAAVIRDSARFREHARGVTPFFVDAYAPYCYWAFDAI